MGMMINRRRAYGGEKLPYVQDGLVLWLDGIWNAGIGKHNNNVTTWVDLSGNGHDAVFSRGHQGSGMNPKTYWGDNCLVYPDDSVSVAEFTANLGGTLTLQFCYSNFQKKSTFWAFYDTFDDSVNFYHAGNDWGTVVYGARNNRMLTNSSATLLQTKGTITHYFTTGRVGLNFDGVTSYEGTLPNYEASSKKWAIGGPYVTNYFTGNLHCVRIYNRVLTAEEIALNHAIDIQRFNL